MKSTISSQSWRREILDQLRKGNRKPLEEAERKHEVTHRQILNLEHRARLNPLEDTVHGFTVQEVKKVLAAAEEAKNDEQVKLLQKVIREKRLQLLMRMRGLFEEAREAVAQ